MMACQPHHIMYHEVVLEGTCSKFMINGCRIAKLLEKLNMNGLCESFEFQV